MDKSDATSKQGTEVTAIDRLYDNSVKLIQFARNVAVKQVNTVQLLTYYSLGRWIVEEQQEGSRRAIWAAGYKKAVGEAAGNSILFIKTGSAKQCLTCLRLKKAKQCLAFSRIRCPFHCSGRIIWC